MAEDLKGRLRAFVGTVAANPGATPPSPGAALEWLLRCPDCGSSRASSPGAAALSLLEHLERLKAPAAPRAGHCPTCGAAVAPAARTR